MTIKNKTLRELIDEIPEEGFLMSTQNMSTKKWIVTYKNDPVAQFDTKDEADKYIGRFNTAKIKIRSARTLRNFINFGR